MAQRTLRDSTLKIKDGGSNEVTVVIGEGNFTWTEHQNIEYTLNAGKIKSADGGAARLGDDAPVDVSFDILFEYYVSAGSEDETPIEALKKTGAASSWVTADSSDPCAPYAVDLELVYDPDCTTGITDPIETTTLSVFRHADLNFDLSAGQISVTGTCQDITVASVRSA